MWTHQEKCWPLLSASARQLSQRGYLYRDWNSPFSAAVDSGPDVASRRNVSFASLAQVLSSAGLRLHLPCQVRASRYVVGVSFCLLPQRRPSRSHDWTLHIWTREWFESRPSTLHENLVRRGRHFSNEHHTPWAGFPPLTAEPLLTLSQKNEKSSRHAPLYASKAEAVARGMELPSSRRTTQSSLHDSDPPRPNMTTLTMRAPPSFFTNPTLRPWEGRPSLGMPPALNPRPEKVELPSIHEVSTKAGFWGLGEGVG